MARDCQLFAMATVLELQKVISLSDIMLSLWTTSILSLSLGRLTNSKLFSLEINIFGIIDR